MSSNSTNQKSGNLRDSGDLQIKIIHADPAVNGGEDVRNWN
jgi:hypothetical protein